VDRQDIATICDRWSQPHVGSLEAEVHFLLLRSRGLNLRLSGTTVFMPGIFRTQVRISGCRKPRGSTMTEGEVEGTENITKTNRRHGSMAVGMETISRILPRWLTAGQEHKEHGKHQTTLSRITKTPHSPTARRTLAKPSPVFQGKGPSGKFALAILLSMTSVLIITPCTKHPDSHEERIQPGLSLPSSSQALGHGSKSPRFSCKPMSSLRCCWGGISLNTSTRASLHALSR
jgi:hypothetical protein